MALEMLIADVWVLDGLVLSVLGYSLVFLRLLLFDLSPSARLSPNLVRLRCLA